MRPHDPVPRRAPIIGWIAATTGALLVVGAAASRGLPVPSSRSVYDRAITNVAAAPDWVGSGLELLSELGLVLLAVAAVWTVWRQRRHPAGLARIGAAVIGVMMAYVISEALKIALAEPRPCLSLPAGTTVADCPGATDWSLPSNHSAIAAALATALVLWSPRSAWWAVPLALGVGASRVLIGVHYPHDVLTGMLLAVAIVIGATLLLERPVTTLTNRLRDVSAGDRPPGR